MKNYKITPFEYKKTKLCPICNSKLEIKHHQDYDDVKNKRKICKDKGHLFLLNNEYGENYDHFYLERVGLNKTVIDSNYEYDKWANTILPNGMRLKGELYYQPNVQKMLSLNNLQRLFLKWVKFPRTYHFPWSPNLQNDDRMIHGFVLAMMLDQPGLIMDCLFYKDELK